jgi:signal transduction histidine kinase
VLLSPPVYLSEVSENFAGRSAVDLAQLEAFQETVLRPGLEPALHVKDPYLAPGRSEYALPVSLPSGALGGVLHVELSLDELARWLQEQSRDGIEIGIIDAQGSLFLSSGDELLVPRHFRSFVGSDILTTEVNYTTPAGVNVLASSAPIPQAGWTVIAATPTILVTRAQQSVQARTAYIAVVLTLVSLVWGVFFVRELVRPIVSLKDAALSVAAGRLGYAVPDFPTVDEVGELGRAFNHMSRSLEQSAAELEDKNAEIEAFNQDLQARVEERTQQLQAAQVQLVRSERLAAVGELSSGIAHELNNPMAGILGIAQLMRAQQPADPMLRAMEEQALRCRDILSHLNQLTQRSREDPLMDMVDFTVLLHGVLTVVRPQLLQRGVQVTVDEMPPTPIFGDRAALGRAMTTTLLGIRSLFPSTGGTLRVSPHRIAGQVGVQIVADGARPPGGDDWMASGLGLWVARQILSQHGGGLRPPVGHDGMCFVFWLPEIA